MSFYATRTPNKKDRQSMLDAAATNKATNMAGSNDPLEQIYGKATLETDPAKKRALVDQFKARQSLPTQLGGLGAGADQPQPQGQPPPMPMPSGAMEPQSLIAGHEARMAASDPAFYRNRKMPQNYAA